MAEKPFWVFMNSDEVDIFDTALIQKIIIKFEKQRKSI